LSLAFSASTVKVNEISAVAEVGAVTTRWVTAVEAVVVVVVATSTAALVPVIELVLVSVAVMVWSPAVLRVMVKVPVPSVRAEAAGSEAVESVEVIVTGSV
jgi:hypothetical protein